MWQVNHSGDRHHPTWHPELARCRILIVLKLLQELGPALELRSPASESTIADVQRQLVWAFPAEYLAFLRATNGCEGFLATGDYIVLWPVERLVEAQIGYGYPEFCPEAVAFGTNGGGEAFVFKRGNGHIARMDLCSLDIKSAIEVGPLFTDFLRRGRPSD